MTRVLLALALGLASAAGGSTDAVPAPVPGSSGLLVQQRGARAPIDRSHDPESDRPGGCAGDLLDSQESPDHGLPQAAGAPDEGQAPRRSSWRPSTPTCPDPLLEAPKTGPPSACTPDR